MINLDNDYSINRSKLSFNINDINLVLRVSDIKDTIRTTNMDYLYDISNSLQIKLAKIKSGYYRLFDYSCNYKFSDKDLLVNSMKSDKDFMNLVFYCIKIISENFRSRSIDYSNIIDENPPYNCDIIIKWYNDSINTNKLIITIF